MSDTWLLSLIIFVPSLFAAVLLFFPKGSDQAMKHFTLAGTIVTFALCLFWLYPRFMNLPSDLPRAMEERAKLTRGDDSRERLNDLIVRKPWINTESFQIEYLLGVDGISLSLILLTGLLGVLSMLASYPIDKHVKGYCILYLLLETGMMGVFLAVLDFFLFYVFFEVMLLPMYFLIGIWGGPRREYAAIKFFLFTLVGSVLILIALLGFYFTSDPHSFDLLRLAEMARTDVGGRPAFSYSFQMWMFALLFIGFAIKLPAVPVHTWLPDAHVEAPTPISMILAGVLLKIGGYGLIRIAYPLCPDGAYFAALPVALVGVISIIYGAFTAMAQTDFKKLVAYSSVSHMGYVTLGLAVLPVMSAQYYAWGLAGAVFQMLGHGITSAGMFFMVGVIYERAHHRDLNRFGGLMNAMPLYGGLSMVIFFGAMGLPGLCGFVGEVFTVFAGFKYNVAFGIIAAFGVVLTAGYILWTIQRVYLGSHAHQDHPLPEITGREIAVAVPLVILAIVLGVYPDIVLRFVGPDVEIIAKQLTEAVSEHAKTSPPPTLRAGL